ncbi:MAG TPA: TIGR03936 family radical SAM-associated protein, partial [Polyangia bacterium]
FRRAGLELFYSVGFHPKPDLSFGPALGLGIPSLGELIDVRLIDRLQPDELLRRLRPVSLDGVRFLAAAVLGENDRVLGRVVTQTEFAARLPADTDASDALARFTSGAPLRVRRAADGEAARKSNGAGGGLDRIVDVRKSLLSVDVLEDQAVRVALDWPDGALIRFRISVSQEGSSRPIEVVTALLGQALASRTELARLNLWSSDGEADSIDVLDIEALRRRAPAAPIDNAPPPSTETTPLSL